MNGYSEEEEEADPCKKCGGLLMGRVSDKEDRNGYKKLKIRCVSCGDKTETKFDAHLGCFNWPNCDLYGCGY